MNTQNPNPYIIPGAVIVAALIIAASVMYGPQQARVADNLAPGPAPTGAQPAAGVAVNAKDVDIKGMPFVGKTNAPLTIIYWSDYQCPFCKKFDIETVGQVVKNYVDTGKVKFVFADFQFLGPDSFTLGIAGRAVWEAYPEKYYAWREIIFRNQGQEHSGYATKEFIRTMTAKVPGIDVAKIEALMVKNKAAYEAAMTASKAEGAKVGVTGTPGTVVGNQRLSGAVAYANISAVIDSQLK